MAHFMCFIANTTYHYLKEKKMRAQKDTKKVACIFLYYIFNNKSNQQE